MSSCEKKEVLTERERRLKEELDAGKIIKLSMFIQKGEICIAALFPFLASKAHEELMRKLDEASESWLREQEEEEDQALQAAGEDRREEIRRDMEVRRRHRLCWTCFKKRIMRGR